MVAGCAGLAPESGNDDPGAEELQDRALERMGSVESYSMNTTTAVDIEEATVETRLDGVINQSARKAEFDATTRVNSSRGSNEQSLDMYIDDETMYVSAEGQDRWQSLDVDEISAYGGTNPWENDRIERQRALLEDAEVRATGNATVRGRSTTVIESEPTNESIDEFVDEAFPQQAGFGDADIESVELTQWVTDEGYVLRTEVRMTVTAQGQTANVTVRTEFDDFDEPTDIQIPDEARGGQQA